MHTVIESTIKKVKMVDSGASALESSHEDMVLSHKERQIPRP